MAQNTPEDQSPVALTRAIVLISEALDVVDAVGMCPDAAAHLDLALRRLREKLASRSNDGDKD